MKTYRVCETFSSYQGEGKFAGIEAFFIRFAGCTLNCKFCDEKKKYDEAEEMTEAEMYVMISNIKENIVILTGGEPMEQIDQTLIDMLKVKKKRIHVETNGTNINAINKYLNLIDFITVSPKSLNALKMMTEHMTTRGDGMEFKFLVPLFEQEDLLKNIRFLMEDKKVWDIYLQPVDNHPTNFLECSRLITQFSTMLVERIKISVQLHKIFGHK